MTADELLEQARACYERGRLDYRDVRLETGRLLHGFILAHVEQGRGLSHTTRHRKKLTRQDAVARAADALQVTISRVNSLVGGAMVRELIGDIGTLKLQAVIQFRRFLLRGGTRGQHHRNKNEIDLVESWRIKEGFEVVAPELLRRAVAEDWEQIKARTETQRVFREREPNHRAGGGRKRKPSLSRSGCIQSVPSPLEVARKAASVASVGDLAEQLFEVVRKAAEPLAVAERLLSMVREAEKRKPRRHSFAG